MRLQQILLLTAFWAALFTTLNPFALAFGALLSWLILAACSRLFARAGAGEEVVRTRPLGLVRLTLAFFAELLLSAVSVAKEAWRPRLALRPAVVAVPLDVTSDLEITVLSSLISLTPGTLSLDVSPDRKTLYVHALVADDDGADVRASIKDRLERPVKRAFRRA